MSPKEPLELEVDVKVNDLPLVEHLQKKCKEFSDRIDQIQASTIHAQLAKVGIKYNVPTATWRFLNIGQEKDLGALILKLFEWNATLENLVQHFRKKGKLKEFIAWAHENAFHLSDDGKPERFQIVLDLDPVSDQKDIPPEALEETDPRSRTEPVVD